MLNKSNYPFWFFRDTPPVAPEPPNPPSKIDLDYQRVGSLEVKIYEEYPKDFGIPEWDVVEFEPGKAKEPKMYFYKVNKIENSYYEKNYEHYLERLERYKKELETFNRDKEEWTRLATKWDAEVEEDLKLIELKELERLEAKYRGKNA